MSIEAQAPAATEVAANAPANTAPEAPQVTDIDGLSEFTFQGEKYNPERFHQIFTEHKTWSEKIKEYEKEVEFSNNLQVDLDNVLNDPRLAAQFKSIYPKKYHAILDRYIASGGQSQAPKTEPAQPALPKEFLNEFGEVKNRLKFFEERAYQAEVQTNTAKLDALLPPLFQKFEMANEDQVYARAEGILQSGQKLTEKTWERLVRESHESMQKKADQVYSAKLKKQIEKGQRGADIGAGGATPGQAPKRRTMDDAYNDMIASVTRKMA